MAALNPLIIPSIDYTGNPGLGYYDLCDTEDKLITLCALMHEVVKKSDYVELLLGTEPFDRDDAVVVDEYYINQYQINSRTLSFTCRADYIDGSPPNAVFIYRVYSVSEGLFGDESVSDPRSVLVKRTIPGDPAPGAVGVNNALAKPTGLPPGIKMGAELTITVPAWENMAPGDVVTVLWGGKSFKVSNPPLLAEQVGSPQTIVVPAALIAQAGGNENLPVSYEIHDIVNNWSLHSQAAFLSVYSGPDVLNEPIVLDVPHESSLYSLDLDNHHIGDVELTVPSSVALIEGDILTLTWEGQNADGTLIATPVNTVTVEADGYFENFLVPYEYGRPSPAVRHGCFIG